MARKIGNIRVKEGVDKLRVMGEDCLSVSDIADDIAPGASDPKLSRAMEGFERVRQNYRDALRELGNR